MRKRKTKRQRPPATSLRGRAAALARSSARAIAKQQREQSPGSAGAPQPAKPARKHGRVYRNVGALMRAIFAKNDSVEIATSLLQDSGDTTKAKAYLQFLEYQYGKPAQQTDAPEPEDKSASFDFITHIPQPQYPARAPYSTDSSAARNCAGAAANRAQANETKEEI